MKTAAAYIRVSTDDQLEFSPDSQLKLIQDYAERNDIVLLEEYVYTEESGISGKTMTKRPEFMRMISVAKKKPKPFDVILVWKFSRFARNMEEAITLKSMLKKNDIDVISISEPIPSGPFGDLIERVIEWSDAYYLTNLSQEVKRGMLERASRGLPVCPAPIGYDTKDGMYVPNADANFIKNIFVDFLDGIGLRTLAVKYSNLGLRTIRGNPIDNRAIEYMLRNPVYIGKIRLSTDGKGSSTNFNSPNIMIFDGQHEAIIEQDLFDKVQEKLDEQKRMYGKYQRREQPVQHMLKGLLRCSACDSTLILANIKVPSFQCHSYSRGSCKISHSITEQKANAAVIAAIEDAVITGDFKLVSSDGKQRNDLPKNDYKKLIENEKAKLSRIKLAYQSGVDTLHEYKVNKAKILETIEHLERMMNADIPRVNKKDYIERVVNVLKIVRDSKQTAVSKNVALRTVVKSIVYDKPNRRFEVYFY